MSAAMQHSTTAALPLIVSRFTTAFGEKNKPALGTMDCTTWGELSADFLSRRQGEKDGINIVCARFAPEPDGRVHRVKIKVQARTIIAMDVETNSKTGEVPPSFADAVVMVRKSGLAAAAYTSHNHSEGEPRYRIILPITGEIPAELPATEAMAEILGLCGVLDPSKLGAASVFYLPSCEKGKQGQHHEIIIDGRPIDAVWIEAQASAIVERREAAQAKIRAAAQAEAEARRAAKIAAGFKPTENLIEGIRDRLDLASELLKHGYEKAGDRFLFSGSETGIPGVHIMRGSDGVERVFSHHSGDPLAAGNLPTWCRVKAVDAVDVVTILDFNGNQTQALHELATRFGIGEPLKAKATPEEPPGFFDIPPADNDDRPNNGKASGSTSSGTGETKNSQQMTWQVINPVDLQHRVIPERQWIVQDWLPVGVTTANYGDGGTGKTLLAQQLMTSAAVGLGWCGYEVMQCRSLGLFCEDDQDELHRRQERMCQSLGTDMGQLEPMRWISGVGCDNALVAFTADGRMRRTERWETLELAVVTHQARLVVLDTAADLFTGNENDRNQVRQFIGALNGLALKIKGAVLLNAHPSRTGLATGNLDGGSTAWSNSVRSRWSLARPTGDGEDLDTPERALTRRKANYSTAGVTIRLTWQDGVLTAPARAGGFAAMAQQQNAETTFLSILDRCETAGLRVSNGNTSGNYAPKVFAQRPDRNGHDKRDFEKAMGALFASGMLRLQDYGRKGDARSQIVRASP